MKKIAEYFGENLDILTDLLWIFNNSKVFKIYFQNISAGSPFFQALIGILQNRKNPRDYVSGNFLWNVDNYCFPQKNILPSSHLALRLLPSFSQHSVDPTLYYWQINSHAFPRGLNGLSKNDSISSFNIHMQYGSIDVRYFQQ